MTATFRSLEELRGAVGTSIGPSPWLAVDQKRIDSFVNATGDQWIHVARGYLTLSLIKARFPTPVPAGTRLRATAEFLDLRAVPAANQLVTRYTIDLEYSAKPACIAEMLTLLLP